MSTTAPGPTHNTLESGTFLHPFTDFAEYKNQGGKTFVRGEGIFIIDHLGNRLLDGMSGLWCTNLGYSQDSIKAAITEQLDRLPFYNSFFNCTTDSTLRLADRMTAVLPEAFNHVFFTNSGSEAVCASRRPTLSLPPSRHANTGRNGSTSGPVTGR